MTAAPAARRCSPSAVSASGRALLFAVDYPYEASADAVAGLDAADLDDHQRHLIGRGNAERLLRITSSPIDS